jgi:hypothetical protein
MMTTKLSFRHSAAASLQSTRATATHSSIQFRPTCIDHSSPLDSTPMRNDPNDEPLWQTILGCTCFALLYGLVLVLW